MTSFSSTDEHPYPIVRDFESWKFPHRPGYPGESQLPECWDRLNLEHVDASVAPHSSLEPAVRSRDVTCRITNHRLGTEVAHLVPKAHQAWLQRNNMVTFSTDIRLPAENPANAILLSANIHREFDKKRFAIVPKGGRLVPHVFKPDDQNDAAKLFHNVDLQPLKGVRREFLFASFAYIVISLSEPFFNQGMDRWAVVWNYEKKAHETILHCAGVPPRAGRGTIPGRDIDRPTSVSKRRKPSDCCDDTHIQIQSVEKANADELSWTDQTFSSDSADGGNGLDDDNTETPIDSQITASWKLARLPCPGLEKSVPGSGMMRKAMDSLQFQGMSTRQETISDHYKGTFDWVFSEAESGPGLSKWLQNGSGTYWISGKPGSGKSTLMKFLFEQRRTANHLKQWSAGIPLVTASYFFWGRGTGLQKSLEGLLRTLLFTTLRQHPAFVASVCSRHGAEDGQQISNPPVCASADLEETLQRIVATRDVRFCFFIDGLDEYQQGSEGVDKAFQLIQALAQHQNTKIIISSRPLPWIEDEHRVYPRFQLQDWTTTDIKRIVDEEVNTIQAFGEAHKPVSSSTHPLREALISRAEGVFLWVLLCLRSLRSGMANGELQSELIQRLDSIPSDLDELYRRILSHIPRTDRLEVSKLVYLTEAARAPLHWMTLSFAIDPGLSPNGLPHKEMGFDERSARYKLLRRRLYSRCRGLLEIQTPRLRVAVRDTGLSMSDSTVSFLHRTTRDFLMHQLDQPEQFNTHAILFRAYMIQLRTVSPSSLTWTKFWELTAEALYHAQLSEATFAEALTNEMNDLDRIGRELMRYLLRSRLDDPYAMRKPTLHRHSRKALARFETIQAHWTSYQARGVKSHSFLCFSSQYGLYHYTKEMLDMGLPAEATPGSWSLLDCAISSTAGSHETISSLVQHPLGNLGLRIKLVELLLERGADPNRVDPASCTPWRRLLGEIRNPPNDGTIDPAQIDYWFRAIESFIRYGANLWGLDLRADTLGHLWVYDARRANQLLRVLEKKQMSWSQIKLLFYPRRLLSSRSRAADDKLLAYKVQEEEEDRLKDADDDTRGFSSTNCSLKGAEDPDEIY